MHTMIALAQSTVQLDSGTSGTTTDHTELHCDTELKLLFEAINKDLLSAECFLSLSMRCSLNRIHRK